MIQVVSVNVARASLRTIDGRQVLTAIGKQPVRRISGRACAGPAG